MEKITELKQLLTLLLSLVFSGIYAQHRPLPDSSFLVNNQIASLKIRHCLDLTCLNSTVCDVYNFTPSSKLKSTFTITTPKTNSTYFTTASDSLNYKEYYYNKNDYLIETKSRKTNMICPGKTESSIEITRFNYFEDGQLKSETVMASCCTLKTNYNKITDTTSALTITREYCSERPQKNTQLIFYSNNKIIKEVIDDQEYYTYQYNVNGQLSDIKLFRKINSSNLIRHQKFNYNPDSTLHEEIVQEYYENLPDTKYLDTKYLYAYSDNLIRMITITSYGKISEYLIYNYFQ